MNPKVAATAGFAGFLFAAITVVLLVVLMLAGAVIGIPPLAPCGPGGTGQSVGGVQLDAEQMGNAQTIVSVTAARGLPAHAATVALATAAQESTLHNYLVFKDADSLGLFQQRVRFYTAAVAANPVRATDAFLDRLVNVPEWATRPLTDVAATVQMPREDLRGAYAKWQPLGTSLTAQLWPRAAALARTAGTTTSTSPSTVSVVAIPGTGSVSPSEGTAGVVPPDPCGIAGSGPGGGSPRIPSGMVLTGSAAGNQAVRFALAQLGKPYVWGSNGPNSWDCSSLTQAAWASAGIAIPRTTFTQVDTGNPVALAGVRSGDLVFIAGTGGSAQSPGHVGIVAGRVGATMHLVAAPRTGEVVQMAPASRWASQIVAVRRIG